MSDTPLRIDSIEIANYRCFTRLALELHPELTVIVARNGGGKTAVLDAIAVALGPFVGAFDEAKGVHFAASDARLARQPNTTIAEMESQYPLSVTAAGLVDWRPEQWQRELAGAKAHTTTAEARALKDYGQYVQRLVRDAAAGRGEPPVLPLVSYYGTGRLWSEMRLTAGKKADGQTSRMAGYTDCLAAASRYKAFADWFERLCRAEYEERDRPDRIAEIRDQLAAVRGAVDTVLRPSGWRSIVYKSAEAGIVAEHDDFGLLRVDWLSDGIRSLIGLTADIAHRAVRLNSHLGRDAVTRTPGIVLIDEVDMHLHPEWQQIIVAALRAAFPRLQFIVTTHSPQVLTTVHRDSVRLLREAEEGWRFEAPAFQTRGVESAEVLSRIMGIDPVPQVEEAGWLTSYRALIETDQAESADAHQLRERLVGHFGDSHPLILDCDRLLRFQAFKRRRSLAEGD